MAVAQGYAQQSTYSAHRLELGRCLVLEVIRVSDLLWRPDTLVCWVINILRSPLALVGRVLLGWSLPFTAARDFLTFGVWYHRWNPITIFLIIPIFWLLSLWVWDHGRLILKPVVGLSGFLVDDLKRCVLIPIFRLLSFWVRNFGLVNPVCGLGVFGVIDFLVRVYGWREVLEEAALLARLAVDLDFKLVVFVNDERIEVRGSLGDFGWWGAL